MPKASKAIGKVTSSQLKKRVHATNAAKLFGFVIVKAQPGRVAVRMRVEERNATTNFFRTRTLARPVPAKYGA